MRLICEAKDASGDAHEHVIDLKTSEGGTGAKKNGDSSFVGALMKILEITDAQLQNVGLAIAPKDMDKVYVSLSIALLNCTEEVRIPVVFTQRETATTPPPAKDARNADGVNADPAATEPA